jgi:prepilin-type N-terminal cleavage/methylation domain-containing protein
MSDTRRPLPSGLAAGDEGMTLIETLAALALLLVLMAGLMSVATVALKITENQGNLAARTTEYAQDKMEQLLALTYGDTISDTRVFPAAFNGGTGLFLGGSSDPGAPVNGYVDYLDQSGNILPSNAGPPVTWFYVRVWQVTSPSVNLKQVQVTATVRWGFGGSMAPISTVTALKTWPF